MRSRQWELHHCSIVYTVNSSTSKRFYVGFSELLANACKKGEVGHAPEESVGGCSSPSPRP